MFEAVLSCCHLITFSVNLFSISPRMSFRNRWPCADQAKALAADAQGHEAFAGGLSTLILAQQNGVHAAPAAGVAADDEILVFHIFNLIQPFVRLSK